MAEGNPAHNFQTYTKEVADRAWLKSNEEWLEDYTNSASRKKSAVRLEINRTARYLTEARRCLRLAAESARRAEALIEDKNEDAQAEREKQQCPTQTPQKSG